MSKKNREAKRAEAMANAGNAEAIAERPEVLEPTVITGETADNDVMKPEEIEAERAKLLAEAKAELEKPVDRDTVGVIAPDVTKPGPTPARRPSTTGPNVNPTSIRQIIRNGLLAGEDTKTIAAKVTELHPNSMAAAKSVKHIAYYRSLMRKGGELPKYGAK